jgi:hypothetical protein
MKTTRQINAEAKALRKLKPRVPAKTYFGEDNHAAIDAQIEVLEKQLTEKQIETRWYQDETAEEFRDGDNRLWDEARYARSWIDGDESDAPSSQSCWGGLAKK